MPFEDKEECLCTRRKAQKALLGTAFWENRFKDNASQSLRLGGVCLCERRILKADVKKGNCQSVRRDETVKQNL